MPKRPRSHELETESLRAFEAALPSRWIVRAETPDYGIDRSVEIVDKKGAVTGHRFYVQLKATDAESVRKALAVPLSAAHCRYYSELELPVLIVLYHSRRKTLYARWYHDFDDACPELRKLDPSTRILRFRASDNWGPQSAVMIEADLVLWRRIRTGQLSVPICLTVSADPHTAHGLSSADLLRGVRSLPSRIQSMVQLGEIEHEGALGRIDMRRNRIVVHIGGRYRCTLHMKEKPEIGSPPEVLGNDVMLALSVALDRAGHSGTAAEIAQSCVLGSTLICDPPMAGAITAVFLRSRRFKDAIHLAEELCLARRTQDAAQVVLGALVLNANLLTPDDDSRLHEALRSFADRAEARGEWIAGVARYNVFRYAAGHADQDREAIKHLHRAMELDPRYARAPYVWRELGGMAFDRGRFRWAVRAYRRAVELNGESEYHALLADALVWCGAFRDAGTEFERYLEKTKELEAYWALKAAMLPTVREYAGTDLQRFDEPISSEYLRRGLEGDQATSETAYREALRAHGLCQAAWWNLGQLYIRLNKPDAAFRCFLIVALYWPHDLEAWMNAILVSYQFGLAAPEASRLAHVVLAAAYRSVDESIYQKLADRLALSNPGKELGVVLAPLRELFSHIPRRVLKKEIRLIWADGREVRIPIDVI